MPKIRRMKAIQRQIKKSYPVVIVGGGINGVGIARDCALRGVECLLIEKDDFSSGTSWASSGMIHGGPRYLLSDLDVTRLACLDSGYIQKAAPHLLFRIPFLYTVYKEKSRWQSQLHLEAVESFFEAYDDFVSLKNGQPHSRLSAADIAKLEPGIKQEGLLGGVSFDEWGIDVPRLCVANALDAKEHGATVLNHAKVTNVFKQGNQVTAVEFKDQLTGELHKVGCDILVNATGPWSTQFGKMMGVDIPIRGGKGIHLVFDRKLFHVAIVSQAIDGREVFAFPYENTTIIGTTDDDYFGDLDRQECTQDEIAYLIEALSQRFPQIREARLIYSYSGVRPTIARRGCLEDDLSREHQILDHSSRDGVKGALSLVGGKLASFRIMAEETTDAICQNLGVTSKCTTHEKPLPGGDQKLNIKELVDELSLDAPTVSRLVYRHGSRAQKIFDLIRECPRKSRLVCPCEPVTEAEIEYVMQNEMAYTLSDIRRRTRWTVGPCQGAECLVSGSSLLAEHLGWEANECDDHMLHFLNEWWWNRACVLQGDQLKQEELFQALHFCNQGFGV